VAFEAEADDILRELAREPGIAGASVVTAASGSEAEAEADADDDPDARVRRVPLERGAELAVVLAADDGAVPDGATATAIERAARELKSCILLHGLTQVPEVRLPGRTRRSREALLAHMRELLGALAAMHGAAAAVVTRGKEVVAVGGELTEASRQRLAFVRKRIDAEAVRRRGKTSHAEIIADDLYARSFWFHAYLVVFFERGGWALDFVRHHVRAVARQLARVLPHLDDDPPAPAQIRPRPERPGR
jgi:hypothetical protein